MENFWAILASIIKSIVDFLDWYIEDTTLFEDTLDATYNSCIQVYNQFAPLIAEYIQLIEQYIHGGVT